MRTLRHLLTILLMTAATAVFPGAPAVAADTTPVVGARDFRTAPVLSDGGYSDVLLTGEDLWYGLPIRNDQDTPLEVRASVVSTGPGSADLETWLELMSPTLRPQVSGREPGLLQAEGLGYESGTEQTWIWYLRVSLTSEGRRGQQAAVELHITGTAAQSTGCDEPTGCDASVVASVRQEVQDLRSRLDDMPPVGAATESRQGLQDEIAALAAERDRLLQPVAPDPRPGGRPRTPVATVGVLVLLALGVGVAVRRTGVATRLRAQRTEEPARSPTPQALGSAATARRPSGVSDP